MAEPFKNMYNEPFLDRFTKDLKLVIPDLDTRIFTSQVMDKDWEDRELKQRTAHMATVLRQFLPADYKESVDKILLLLDHIEPRYPHCSQIDDTKFGLLLEYGGILDSYIEQYGLDDYETSVKAIERITQFSSCEFVTHPFIVKYPEAMMAQMLIWSKHEHWGVRRLASEGCRPRLPWAMALPSLKADPTPILPILENLKNDPARFVRLSVANNLNDIAKDNPQVVIDLVKRWQGESEEVDWIIKHGCRTLLKQGNPEVMELFGLGSTKHIMIENFRIVTPQVKVGDSLEFSFNLSNNNNKKAKIRLEYSLYYQKANGTLSKKVCKISEKDYAAHSTTAITRKHSFKVVTTRKLHPGLHQVAIIINGNEFEKHDFELVE
ncbi:3-methyladenine DNA glycosylase AlkC [Parabacteroides sp. PFB2-12]|uniref:DNA alkylation repair protein n=1 Tax=unclassified Parabacteroides TaxID=2649774 RepID=UPI0024743459|nr:MULTISPECIES: DNA alkylation repair protein [unclassified Parabacteroides]MDH6342496.1 3-methyladenine DNA glycosylase AlkC [Parabacteroides sp. PM6-13]MDH6390148.1 3-methyladenine DNA glycosylase AlkC [Parabacteroides sp. PFB2-12]